MTGPRLTTTTVAATAGNATAVITVPPGGMYKMIYGEVALTTDATVANRRIVLTAANSSGGTIVHTHAGAVVAASGTDQHHVFMQGIFRETTFIAGELQVPIPTDFWLNENETVTISIDAGVAGDSYTASLTFEFQEKPPF